MLSLPHLFFITLIVFIVFGAGKLPKVMGDLGKGIRTLKEGMNGDEVVADTTKPRVEPARIQDAAIDVTPAATVSDPERRV